MKIVITGYSYIYQRFFKMFDYFPQDFEFIFVLPKVWKAKKGKIVYRPPVSEKHQVITTKAYFNHSNYPIIGGILKGWQPGLKKSLKKALKKEKIDLIYSASEPHLLSTYYNSKTAKKLGIKHIIFSWENIHFREKFSGLKLKIFEKLINKNLKLSKGIFCGNQKALNIFNSYNPDILKTICPISGVDTALYKPSQKTGEKISFLFAGALGKRKGIFLIIEAFKNLNKKYSNLELIFCGTGTDEALLKNKVKKENLNNKIQFFNWLSAEKLAQKFSQADVFLYPSMPEKGWEEQFGFSMVEAQSAGLPVIATKIGSIAEVVKDQETGVLIEPNNQVALEQAMERLIKDKDFRNKLGENGRRFVLENFSYQKVAEKISDFFIKVNDNE